MFDRHREVNAMNNDLISRSKNYCPKCGAKMDVGNKST